MASGSDEDTTDSESTLLTVQRSIHIHTVPLLRASLIHKAVGAVGLSLALGAMAFFISGRIIADEGAAGKVRGDTWFLRKHEEHQTTDYLLIDAGSTGSKVFSFHTSCEDGGHVVKDGIHEKHSKLYTECTAKHREEGKTLTGLASLAYSKEECEWLVGSAGSDYAERPLGSPQNYVKELLQLLADTYKEFSGKTTLEAVENSLAVPMLGTAGMRLRTQEENEKIWGFICNQTHSGIKLAPAGDMCGTIPGTMEAYYEFLANAASGDSRVLTGVFTIGGASAQIALPLQSEQEVKAFRELKDKIAEELDCTKLILPCKRQAPIFNTVREGGKAKECIDDYITYMPKQDIQATRKVLEKNIRTSDILGLGLISFLGLRGAGGFFAGGVDAIYYWADEVKCNGDEASFRSCKDKFRDALEHDIMFKHVRQFFTEKNVCAHNFSFNTYAAYPKASGIDGVEGENQAWDLLDGLNEKCGKDASIKFGYKNSNSCMKAFWTATYLTSFFEQVDKSKKHDMDEITYAPNDWANGFIEEYSHASRRLLGTRLHYPKRTYADGARIHFYGNPT